MATATATPFAATFPPGRPRAIPHARRGRPIPRGERCPIPCVRRKAPMIAGRRPGLRMRCFPVALPPGPSPPGPISGRAPGTAPRFLPRSAGAPLPIIPTGHCRDHRPAVAVSCPAGAIRTRCGPLTSAAPLAHPADNFDRGDYSAHSMGAVDYPRFTVDGRHPRGVASPQYRMAPIRARQTLSHRRDPLFSGDLTSADTPEIGNLQSFGVTPATPESNRRWDDGRRGPSKSGGT